MPWRNRNAAFSPSNKRRAPIRLLSILLCSLSFSRAQSTAPSGNTDAIDPEKSALIRQIVEGAESDQLRQRILTAVVPRYVASKRQNPVYPAPFVDEFEKTLKERVNAIDLVKLVAPIYAQRFSVDELKHILASRTSPDPVQAADAPPQIRPEIFKRAYASTHQLAVEIEEEIDSQHPDYAKQIRDNEEKLGPINYTDPLMGVGALTDPSGGPHVNTGEPYRIGGGVTAPGLIQKVSPEYTPEAKKAQREGTVLLSIVVDANGVPRNLHVLQSLGLGLDEKAVDAVTKWRFRPGMKDGKPVATQAQVEVNFRLLKKPPQ